MSVLEILLGSMRPPEVEGKTCFRVNCCTDAVPPLPAIVNKQPSRIRVELIAIIGAASRPMKGRYVEQVGSLDVLDTMKKGS
eukprot:6212252-Pleurochrysis_carterae.AAC.4